jgi:pilus assembly protein FimV
MAESLYANLGSDPENEMWQRILPMGRELCPDHVLFGGAGDTAEMVDSGMLDDQVSAGGDGVVAGVMESFSPETAASPGEESFDLDLGGGQAAGNDLDEGVEAAPEGKMEFDLNLGGENGGESMAAVAEEPAAEAQESLSTAPELGELATAAEEQVKETVDSDQGNAAAESEGRGESWEIEPAASDFGNIDFGLDDGDLLAGTDVVGTKLDLARAYIDMGDNDSARDILTEVIEEGNAQQKQEAQGLVEKIA